MNANRYSFVLKKATDNLEIELEIRLFEIFNSIYGL
ncbi:hypothetical protein J2Z25_000546 [Clostridium tertium]|nr:hypothetical protein [Clostridium tertium]